MPYAPLLSEPDLDQALNGLPDWTPDGAVITRTVRCSSFRQAIELVNRVADAAEAADHHPDIDIVWRRVTFRLTSKASGGLTAKDVELAATIDRLAAEPTPEGPFREAFPIIQASDIDRLIAFYTDGLGFEVGYRFPPDGPIDYAFLKLSPLGIGIGRRPDGTAEPPANRGWELWIYADDVDTAVESVSRLGASVLEPPADQPWGERVALVADPEGNRIHIGARG